MKKADKPDVIIINGSNNRVSCGEKRSLSRAIVILAIAIDVAVAVLAVSHCCPDLLADFVRWLTNIAIGR